ncbi:MAG: N-6 DNA methylase [Candidatus Aminicenantes bacterium]|nr:N-6 DNA methylase [Candidatus Aminicenantes bacterium]
MTIQEYLENINRRFKTGISSEHTYRGDLQTLLQGMAPGFLVTNEPARIECGAPDYVITKKDVPIGYIEAKDIGVDLSGKALTEQFDRYRSSLENLVFTDYLEFRRYKDGEFVASTRIAEIKKGAIVPLPQNFKAFTDLIEDFIAYKGQTIRSPKKLAVMMAAKARLLSLVIESALNSDEKNKEDSTIKEQMNAFKEILIHDIKPKEFADIYAQTIAYGMFAARLQDPSLKTFSRQEAAELIPKSNPFLRKLFQYIAGYDLDDRLKWIVDALADIFRATNVNYLLNELGGTIQVNDPVIHFYETFLAEYDPKVRKARGVWYTPAPVVNFIVRAVDDILKTEFNLPMGLADASKTKTDPEVHRVQILDPAAGTGTFLAEVVKFIYDRFQGQQGIWSNYVENHLIPRLNGFELLMASYAMAYLKLEMLLSETGFKPKKEQRFRIYLTNSLEEIVEYKKTLFVDWLSAEANEAHRIKQDTPVMVVLGNPPYSISSTNKSDWIEGLTADYKKDLNERNIQPLSDDYIKFIRFGQHFIDKNGEGVLAYISNNGFIDGLIHRQMRKHLLESFDKIYILDLHGNSKKKETAPDGSPDQNIFDIMQGVSINIFIKTGKKKESQLGEVFQFDLQGKREFKNDTLIDSTLTNIDWQKLEVKPPDYYFVKKDFDIFENYCKGFRVPDFFQLMSSGIKTHRDHFVIDFDVTGLSNRIERFYNLATPDDEIRRQLDLEDNPNWSMVEARNKGIYKKSFINEMLYRPFDWRYIYYDQLLIDRAREKGMKHLKCGDNLGLILVAQAQAANLNYFDCVYITNVLTDTNMFRRGGPSTFPLYLYPETGKQKTLLETTERTPNLDMKIVGQMAEKLGLRFTNEKETTADTFASFTPIDILDYIYAVLHSPTYREKYKEFLKIDFPRVPYPKDVETFWQLVALGGQLRQIHLLESPIVEKYITTYPQEGSNVVGKIKYEDNKVWINDQQYFENVPQIAWEFYIGGYQPAQKWLKDRKDRELSFEDILHYQKIIVALFETDRLMKAIDEIEIEE